MDSAVRIEPDEAPTFLAIYGQMDVVALTSEDRVRQLWPIINDLLTSSGASPWSAAPLVDSVPVAGLKADGVKGLLGVTWQDCPMSIQDVGRWRQAAAQRTHLQIVLLSMSGFEPAALEAHSAVGPPLVLLDRAHFEAALCGLITIGEIVAAAGNQAVFNRVEFTSLTDLLLGSGPPDTQPPGFMSPMRLPAPWDLTIDLPGATSMRHLFTGDAGWSEPLGFAVSDTGSLLITTSQGIVEVDAIRGTTSWLLPLPGCDGDPLPRSDGGTLVRCGSAIIEWKGGVITPIAGDLGDSRTLFAGPHGQAWVLCGDGAHMGQDAGSLALVKLGSAVGEQMRHPISFNANVLNAGWIGELKFFLAAEGNSAVLDLARANMVRREDWMETPVSPARMVVAGPREVITASHNGKGVAVSIFGTDPETRTSTLIAELRLNYVKGLTVGPAGQLYVLGDVRGNAATPHPLIVSVGYAPPVVADQPMPGPGRSASPQPASGGMAPPAQRLTAAPSNSRPSRNTEAFDAVQVEARGQKKDYRMDARPLGDGGQAEVFGAEHKTTGIRVAFKRLTYRGNDHRARLKREVDAGRKFGGHPHVMPVLDHSPDHEWLVMPLADYAASHKAADLADPVQLRVMINAICEALREPHELGWIHRDLKPDNILWLGNRWVVADWGLGRRPRGQTTLPGRTPMGGSFGTEGFAAPELSIDAHTAGPQADVYSIGQIIGWALTQSWPRANRPLVPPDGPWRGVVRAATHEDPARRPATVDELLDLIRLEVDAPPLAPLEQGLELLAATRTGNRAAAAAIFALAADNRASYELYMEVVVRLDDDSTRAAVSTDVIVAREVVRAAQDVHSGGHVALEYSDVDALATWLLVVAYHAEASEEWDLLGDTTDSLFYLDDRWDRWNMRSEIRAWLASRTDHAASIAAGSLRRFPESRSHFSELAQRVGVDHRIRAALAG